MSYDSKKRFETLCRDSYFTRVDETHPLELWIGVDSGGHKALRFLGEFNPVSLSGTKSIEVKQFYSGSQKCIQFALIDPESAELFYKFCDDIIESSRENANQQGGYHFLTYRFSRWKRMFITKSDILSEEQIMGLIGELYFLLAFMIPHYGQHKAIEAWSAPDPTVKDFSIDNTWYEIKAIGSRSPTVKINSLQQLDFSEPGNLVVLRLEKMSASFLGNNLNQLTLKISQMLESPDDVDVFQTKLNLAGYGYNDKYNDYVYDIKDMTLYQVDNSFPALRAHDMEPAVQNVQYDLLLDQISPFIKPQEKK
jgi:hypothetical protein